MKKTFLSLAVLMLLSLVSFTATAQQEENVVDVRYATFNIRLDAKWDGENNWKYRKDSVVSFINAQQVDIVGMQEVLPKPLKFLKRHLKKNYAYIGVGREDGKKKGEHTPIFYNKKKFQLVDNGNFWLSQEPNKAGMIGWDAACPRIVTWGKFQDKKSGEVFVVFNTHFDHVGAVAQKNSANLILDSIKTIAGELPVIMSGDFNVTDTSQAYQIMTHHPYGLKDTHKIAKQRTGNTYTFHDFGKRELDKRGKIDFIFVNKKIDVRSSFIPIEPQQAKKGFLSDHNPVVVQLKLKKQ